MIIDTSAVVAILRNEPDAASFAKAIAAAPQRRMSAGTVGEPLLFKGKDFSHTDVKTVL